MRAQLMNLFDAVDEHLTSLELPPYHSEPLPHMSIAFVDADVARALADNGVNALDAAQLERVRECVSDELLLDRAVPFTLGAIVVQCGQRVERFPLVQRHPLVSLYFAFVAFTECTPQGA